jgi:secreted Zn-dependent insulinase-like peptidase
LDDRYALPKANITILLRTAAAENKLMSSAAGGARWDFDACSSMKSNFITKIFADALAQETYDARLAGLGWSLSKSSSGFTLSCSGYSDRLPDLAMKLLTDFCHVSDDSFLRESYFIATKDKIVRGLTSYFESSRADSLALYYRNLLLSSQGKGIEANLEVADSMTYVDIVNQHREIWADTGMVLEVLYTGNVSKKEAKTLFEKATDVIERTQAMVLQDRIKNSSPLAPGPIERRLPAGEDLELHFSSKNPQEGKLTVE